MEAKLFFKKAEETYSILLEHLTAIETEHAGTKLEVFEKCLMSIDQSVRELKLLVKEVAFNAVAEEVRFFKEVKPLFVSQFIYYSKILEIEAARPNAGELVLKQYYEMELQQLKGFIDEYADFYEYYRRKASYMDEKYFVRHYIDFKMSIDAHLYNYDEQFTTSHDYLIAQIIANDRMERYLLSSIYELEGYFFEKFSDKSPLTWTASKAALIEMLYGLHISRSFNGGDLDFSEIVKFAEKSFNIKLGNFYKTLYEIKGRKTGRTKFIEGINEQLLQHFENGDL